MRGGPDVPDLAAQVVDVHAERVGEGDERRGEFDVTPVHVGPHRRRKRHPPGEERVPDVVVPDDRGPVEEVVPEGVVTVVVGVDQGRHWTVGDVGDGLPVRAGAPLGGAGIDADDTLAADEESGVVDPPGPVGLDVRVDPVAHLDGAPGRGVRVVHTVRTHGAHHRACAAPHGKTPKRRLRHGATGTARGLVRSSPGTVGQSRPPLPQPHAARRRLLNLTRGGGRLTWGSPRSTTSMCHVIAPRSAPEQLVTVRGRVTKHGMQSIRDEPWATN